MAEREERVVVTRTLRESPERVWAFLADTNRWDRLMGLADAKYQWRTHPDGTRDRVGTSKQYGLELSWVEPPYEWVEGLWVEGRRKILSGPLRSAGFRASVRELPEGSGVTVEMYLSGQAALTRVLAAAARPRFRASIESYLDAMERIFSRPAPVEDSLGVLPIELARRILLARPEPALTGPVSSVNRSEITARSEKLKSDPRVDKSLCDQLVTWTMEAPDEALESMRPYELARAWKSDKSATLRAFLHATRAGLLDMRWKINCPACKVTAASTGTLSELGRSVHCEACNVSYGVDFASQIEAVFSPNAAVRLVSPKVYCASSAWFRPHLFAVVALEAHETREFRARWADDISALRLAQSPVFTEIVRSDKAPEKLRVRALAEGFDAVLSGQSADGFTEVTLTNETERRVVLQIEHASGPADAVPGTAMLTFPDYLDLFATEAPARGVELSVGSIAMLFTDLTGSTALYQKVGDARAFALIEQHFREMTEAVLRHEGAVIKTMGDAVMATFPTTRQGLLAAIEMAQSTAKSSGAHGMALKIGLHTGPCLAVRANDRMDFFGTTVNLAARLQAKAGPGEVVLLAATLEARDIADTVRDFPSREFVAPLKGIVEEQRLIAYAIPGAAPSEGS